MANAHNRAPIRPTPVPARRPLRARVSTGHIVMVVAGLLGALLTLQVLRSADDRREVLTLRRNVPAGEVVTAADLTTTRVRVDSTVERSLVAADERGAVVGEVATRPLRAGDLVNRHDIRRGAPGTGLRSMTIPIETSRAVGGDLVAGDRVDVIATTDEGSEFIVTDAEVLRTGGGESDGPLRSSSDKYFVKIAVDAPEATAIAYGLKHGSLDVIAATGADPVLESELRRSGGSGTTDPPSTSSSASKQTSTTTAPRASGATGVDG